MNVGFVWHSCWLVIRRVTSGIPGVHVLRAPSILKCWGAPTVLHLFLFYMKIANEIINGKRFISRPRKLTIQFRAVITDHSRGIGNLAEKLICEGDALLCFATKAQKGQPRSYGGGGGAIIARTFRISFRGRGSGRRSSRGLLRQVSEASGVIGDHRADLYDEFPRPWKWRRSSRGLLGKVS